LQEEGRRTYRDAVIAGLIALAATAALFLDTRIENRASVAGGAARAVFGRGGPDAVASAWGPDPGCAEGTWRRGEALNQMKRVVRALAPAAAVSLGAAMLVACSGGSGGTPTIVEAPAGAISTFTASDATASDDGTGTETSPDGRPSGPPEEALAACDNSAESDACSFMSPRDGSAVDGTCRARRDDASQYVCFPNDWDGRGRRGERRDGPPEEALAACEGVETGVTCSFETPFGSIDGTCSAGPDGSGQVVCRPEWDGEGRPGGRRGGEEARATCEGRATDATCSFEAPFGSITGTCRVGRDGSSLVCFGENRS